MPHETRWVVLVVEDDEDIAQVLVDKLAARGYQTHVARNDIEALQAFAAFRPHIAFLDIVLKGSDRDGLAILESLREGDEALSACVVTGHGDVESYQWRATRFSPVWLLKPYSEAAFESALHEVHQQLKHPEFFREAARSGVPSNSAARMLSAVRSQEESSRVILTTDEHFDRQRPVAHGRVDVYTLLQFCAIGSGFISGLSLSAWLLFGVIVISPFLSFVGLFSAPIFWLMSHVARKEVKQQLEATK